MLCVDGCVIGSSIRVQSNNSCCPDCKKCEAFEMIQGGHCQPCPNGQKPNENRSRCQLIEEQVIDYRNPWVAASMAFAILGKSRLNY